MKRSGAIARITPLERRQPLQRAKRREAIRSLRWDEPIPESEPRRFRNGAGYIRLRWLVAPNLYVEEYEHRINAGRPHPRFDVHHINDVKTDNRPENLQVLTRAEHAALHAQETKGRGRYAPYRSKGAMEKAQRGKALRERRRAEVERMRALYESGRTTEEVASELGIHPCQVSRRLRAVGVTMRTASEYASSLDVEEIGRRYAAGRSPLSLAQEYKVTGSRIYGAIDLAGMPRRRAIRKAPASAGESQARRLVYERSGGVCERCGAARATEWHHRLARGRGGRWSAGNGLHLCGRCHGAVTNTNGKRAEYVANGWIVRSGADPAAKPVLIHTTALGHALVFLDDDGGVRLAGDAA